MQLKENCKLDHIKAYFQKNIDSSKSKIHFLREELKERNRMKKALINRAEQITRKQTIFQTNSNKNDAKT